MVGPDFMSDKVGSCYLGVVTWLYFLYTASTPVINIELVE